MLTSTKASRMRFLSALVACGGLLAGVRTAQAAPEFSQWKAFTIGVEDFTGYESRSVDYNDAGGEHIEQTRSRLALALTGGSTKLGVHYFVIPHLSVGAFVGFESSPASTTTHLPGESQTNRLPTGSRALIAPRVGYALMFRPSIGVWFRAGIGYERTKYRIDEVSSGRDSFGLFSGDILLLWSPVPCFALSLGPTADLSFTGSHNERDAERRSWSNSASMQRLAMMVGLHGYF
ncbi:MAG TPA: hypothetical protein VKP30_01570 [Polyangiaceae bacterium]|nr:hypothetical protein [Polyangiaceae bacterium]